MKQAIYLAIDLINFHFRSFWRCECWFATKFKSLSRIRNTLFQVQRYFKIYYSIIMNKELNQRYSMDSCPKALWFPRTSRKIHHPLRRIKYSKIHLIMLLPLWNMISVLYHKEWCHWIQCKQSNWKKLKWNMKTKP